LFTCITSLTICNLLEIFVCMYENFQAKGTVAGNFLASGFIHGSTLYWPQISRLKEFSFLFRLREVIRIFP
jgi:hypothetical protein